MHDFQKAWLEFEPTDGPNLLAGDELLLQPKISARLVVLHRSWESFVAADSFGTRDKKLHLSLLPQPFFGAITSARVFVLTLNPGLHPTDYYGDFLVPEYREALTNTLKQCPDGRFPLIWFDPRFSWHDGFSYWHGRFARLVDRFAKESKIPRVEALSFFAKSTAVLELLPYHSVSFGLPPSIMTALRSVQLARSFVSDVLVPRARDEEVLLIAARQGRTWDLPAHENAIVYDRWEARAAHLTPQSRGGEAILKHIKKIWRNDA